MKKYSVRIAFTLAAVALALSTYGAPRPGGNQGRANGGASLDAALDIVERAVKNVTGRDFRMKQLRITITRLTRDGRCKILLRSSTVPGFQARETGRPAEEMSSSELAVDLALLDPDGVTVVKPKIAESARDDNRIIHFTSAGDNKAIKSRVMAPGQSGYRTQGGIVVAEDVASEVAAALKEAISICRQ